MITFDYRFSQVPSPREASVDIPNADEDDLVYTLFPGDIVFKVGNCDYSALWDWIPIVGFASSLRDTAHELEQTKGAESVLEFTENDATIRFVRREDVVAISASYVSCDAQVQWTELREAVDDFSRRVMAGALRERPLLKENRALQKFLTQP